VLTAAQPDPLDDGAIQVEVRLRIRRRRGEPSGHGGPASRAAGLPRIPRITRLMALAIKFQQMIDCGEVRDYADLARLGYVTRARITQIMNLLLLSPTLQQNLIEAEEQLFRVTESQLRHIVAAVDWSEQRRLWATFMPTA
jgi:hypothetical protein